MNHSANRPADNAILRRQDFEHFTAMRSASARLRDQVRKAQGLDPFPVAPIRMAPRRKPICFVVPETPTPEVERGMPIAARRIVNEIAAAMNLDAVEIYSRSRVHHIVLARHLVMTVLTRRGSSYSRVGQWMGLDHSTVINGVRRFEERATPYMRQIAAKYVGRT